MTCRHHLVSDVSDRLPAFHQFSEKPPRAEQLGEHRKDLVDSGGRRGSDGLRSGGVDRLSDMAGDGDVGADDLSCGDAEMIEGLTRSEIEDPVEGYFIAVQHAGEQALDTDDQPFAAVAQLGSSTGPRGAQINDWEAVGWVEPAAMDAGTLAAQGILPAGCHVTERFTEIDDSWRSGDVLGADLYVRR